MNPAFEQLKYKQNYFNKNKVFHEKNKLKKTSSENEHLMCENRNRQT